MSPGGANHLIELSSLRHVKLRSTWVFVIIIIIIIIITIFIERTIQASLSQRRWYSDVGNMDSRKGKRGEFWDCVWVSLIAFVSNSYSHHQLHSSDQWRQQIALDTVYYCSIGLYISVLIIIIIIIIIIISNISNSSIVVVIIIIITIIVFILEKAVQYNSTQTSR